MSSGCDGCDRAIGTAILTGRFKVLGSNVVDVDLVVLTEVTIPDDVLQLNSGKGLWYAKTLEVATQFINAMVCCGCCCSQMGLWLNLRKVVTLLSIYVLLYLIFVHFIYSFT